jgi:hypothetical protein
MNNKIITFIFGVYISLSVSISGYFYINPTEVWRFWDGFEYENYGTPHYDFINLKYSVLISIVIGILLYSFLQLFKKTKKTI